MKPIPRKELREFAAAMELELQRHDPLKGDSWKRMNHNQLTFMLGTVIGRFHKLTTLTLDPAQMRAELVDMANVAMMLYHRLDLEDK